MKNTARNVALNFLSRREYAVEELRSKLLSKNFPSEEVEAVIERLMLENLLSEERFVESFIRAKCEKGYGPLAIKNELFMRKVSEALIEQTFSQMNITWQENINKVFEKKFSTSDLTDLKEKNRCWRFLSQRGFTPDQIGQLIKTLYEVVD